MKWYKPLYFGNNLQTKRLQNKVLRRLTHNVFQDEIFLIVLCENGKDLFRIIPSVELLQKGYPKDDLFVLGIAKGKDDALTLVEKMLSEVYMRDGDLKHVKEFYKSGRGRR